MSVIITLLVAASVLFVPGLVIAIAAGARGFAAVATAPGLSVGVVGVAGIVAAEVGIRWGAVPVVITAGGAALVVALLRRWVTAPRSRQEDPTHGETWAITRWWPALAGAAAAAVVGSAVLWPAMGGASGFSQSFDNVFHLDAIRYIIETGDASSFHIYSMTYADPPSEFYPLAWHGMAALITQLAGTPLTLAANCLNLLIAVVVWPVGVLALARSAWQLSAFAQVAGGVVMMAFTSFPYLLLHWGVLSPNALAYALIPSGVLVLGCTVGSLPRRPMRASSALFLAPVLIAGIAIAHPSGLVALVLLVTPAAVGVVLSRVRAGAWAWYVGCVAIALWLLLVLGTWIVLRPSSSASSWEPFETPAQALGEGLSNAEMGRGIAYVVTLCVISGAVLALRKRSGRGLVAAWALALGLYVVAASAEPGGVRYALVGPWYADPHRLAALVPIAAAPLVLLGLDGLARLVEPRIAEWRRGARVGLAAVTCILLVPLVITPSFRAALADMRRLYVVRDDTWLVTTDELALIERLPAEVGDGVVAIDPWNGGTLAYALEGVAVTHRHVLDSPSQDVTMLDKHLSDPAMRTEVCAAAERAGVTHVLDFGDQRIPGDYGDLSGLDGLENSDLVTEVDREGDAVLYQITGCQ